MQNKTYVLIVASLMIIITISIIFLQTTKPTASPPNEKTEILEQCHTLYYSSPTAINLVFFSPKVQAQKYVDYFLKIKPYNKDTFNIYYIPDYEPECELYKDIAILCYSKNLVKKASSCPNDYIIVLKQKPSNIRSSAYMNVLSINSRHPMSVLPHEMGHALANLAEEYTTAKLPKGQKNCVTSCSKYTSEINECKQGCSEDSYYRSIDNGIMRTLSSHEYGIFDENLIQERIDSELSISKITGQVINEDCQDQTYYLIEANYNSQDNTIQQISQSIQPGCSGTNGYGNFQYTLYNSQDTPIDTDSFNAQLIFTDAPGEIEIDGQIYDNNGKFFLKLSAIPDAKNLEISHKNKITEINLQGIGAYPCKKE